MADFLETMQNLSNVSSAMTGSPSTQTPAEPQDRKTRLGARADQLDKRGKSAKAEDLRLKAEYGTANRADVIAGMTAKQLREFKDDPFKAAGVDARAQAGTARALQGVRQQAANQLNQQLGLGALRGSQGTADAALQAATAFEEGTVKDRGDIAQMARDRIREEGQRRFDAFVGSGQGAAKQGMDPKLQQALAANASDLLKDVDFDPKPKV